MASSIFSLAALLEKQNIEQKVAWPPKYAHRWKMFFPGIRDFRIAKTQLDDPPYRIRKMFYMA